MELSSVFVEFLDQVTSRDSLKKIYQEYGELQKSNRVGENHLRIHDYNRWEVFLRLFCRILHHILMLVLVWDSLQMPYLEKSLM